MSDVASKSGDNTMSWAKLPEGSLPIIRDLVALLENPDQLSGFSEGSFFKDPKNIHTFIEDLVALHRKAGLDSPFLKYRKQEKRKELFSNDDPDWERKLKQALSEAKISGSLKKPAPAALPALPKLDMLGADKLGALKLLESNPTDLQKSNELPTGSAFFLYVISVTALVLSVIALLK